MDSSGMGRGLGDLLEFLFYAAAMGIVGIPILLIAFGWMWFSTPDYKQQAIERGYAEYCSKTGEWAWKGECE